MCIVIAVAPTTLTFFPLKESTATQKQAKASSTCVLVDLLFHGGFADLIPPTRTYTAGPPYIAKASPEPECADACICIGWSLTNNHWILLKSLPEALRRYTYSIGSTHSGRVSSDLSSSGSSVRLMVTETWPKQMRLAARGRAAGEVRRSWRISQAHLRVRDMFMLPCSCMHATEIRVLLPTDLQVMTPA